jgi:hypothetical protein
MAMVLSVIFDYDDNIDAAKRTCEIFEKTNKPYIDPRKSRKLEPVKIKP